MRPEPAQTLDPRAITLWRQQAALRSLWVLIGVGGLASIALTSPARSLTAALLIGGGLGSLWLVWASLAIFWFPQLRYRLWRYALDAHELDLRRGLFVVRRTLIPLIRVQHVDTVQGPLGKRLGLSSVTVSTAAGKHEIPALSDAVADALRDRLSALAREARESL